MLTVYLWFLTWIKCWTKTINQKVDLTGLRWGWYPSCIPGIFCGILYLWNSEKDPCVTFFVPQGGEQPMLMVSESQPASVAACPCFITALGPALWPEILKITTNMTGKILRPLAWAVHPPGPKDITHGSVSLFHGSERLKKFPEKLGIIPLILGLSDQLWSWWSLCNI